MLAGRFHHCGIAVTDLEALVTWYRQTLGFDVDKRFALPDAGLEIVNLISPAGARIELLGSTRAGSEPGVSRSPGAAGTMHVCFLVDDVEAAAAELRQRGAELMQEPKTIPEAGVRNCWITDPEGNLIEFIENL